MAGPVSAFCHTMWAAIRLLSMAQEATRGLGDSPGDLWITRDSGARQHFDTGSVRDMREGKGRYDLLSPFAIRRLAGVLERGAAKYGDRNWEKGQPLARYCDSALRHLFQFLAGETDEDHLGQAMWNLAAAIHTDEMIRRGVLPQALREGLGEYAPRDAHAP